MKRRSYQSKKLRMRRGGISPYVKYQKAPYLYPWQRKVKGDNKETRGNE